MRGHRASGLGAHAGAALLAVAAGLGGCASTPRSGPAAAPAGSAASPGLPPAASPSQDVERAPTGRGDADAAVRYRCPDGLVLRVLFTQDTARLEGLPQGQEILLRDAGGVTPNQSVFSNPGLRAEFGVGPEARGAVLQPLQPPGPALHCEQA